MLETETPTAGHPARLAGALCAVAVAVLITVPRATAEEGPRDGLIVYTSTHPGNLDLAIWDGPGESPHRVAEHPAVDQNPALSPDGRYVVWCSERAGAADLWALDLDAGGAAPVQLTRGVALEDAPAFSPDGRSLVFVGTADGVADVWRMPFRPADPAAAFAAARNLTRGSGRSHFRPAFSPDGRWIAFSGRSAGLGADPMGAAGEPTGFDHAEIFLMRADGTEVTRLTAGERPAGDPVFSPDGRFLYFHRTTDAPGFRLAGGRIWRVRRDGGGEVPVSPPGEVALSPTVLADGRIAYSRQRDRDGWEVAVLDPPGDARTEAEAAAPQPLAGGGLGAGRAPAAASRSTRLAAFGSAPQEGRAAGAWAGGPPRVATLFRDAALGDRRVALRPLRVAFPAVAPDGRRFVGSMLQGGLLSGTLDAYEVESLAPPASGPVWGTAWSPDGAWILATVGPIFAPGDAPVDIWRLRPDGSEATNLTADSPANDAFPAFSPDGRRIVFRSARDGNRELYLMNLDGSGPDGGAPRRLTRDPGRDTMPAFSPDGRQIAFVSNRSGDYEIYTLDLLPGDLPGEVRRRTHSVGYDSHPVYSPDGEWIVFSSVRGGFNDELALGRSFGTPQPAGELWGLRLADGKLVRITHNTWEDGLARWISASGAR